MTMNDPKNLISVVIPVYGCEESLALLYSRLTNAINKLNADYEIIFVNDQSPDASWSCIRKICEADKNVVGINLSRNFGQHNAITAGVHHANGDWLVVMDCDLQDQPEEIGKLYAKAVAGHDIVFGRRHDRQDSRWKIFSSKAFFKVLSYLTGTSHDPAVANFSLISKKVVQSYLLLREQNRSFPMSLKWLGFDTAFVDIAHQSREMGSSSYNLSRLLTLAAQGIVNNSNKPLRLSVKFGLLMSASSFLYAIWLALRYFIYSIEVAGWTSVMISIYFVAGLILFNMGILGIYLGKVFNETKSRPIYVVKELLEKPRENRKV
jgi:glycosyltransferase involved in cell wall biosynthesis